MKKDVHILKEALLQTLASKGIKIEEDVRRVSV